MDGLEAVEIKVNKIDKALLRLEPEYYKKQYLQFEQVSKHYNKLSIYSNRIDCGPFGSSILDTDYKEDGVIVVRPFNLINGSVENRNLVFIDESLIKQNNLKIYENGTLLFSRVGDVKVGVLNRQATISANIVAVVLKDKEKSKFLSIFFNSKYGKLQIQRQLKISAQPTVSTGIIGELSIPNFVELEKKINLIYDLVKEKYEEANEKYEEANQLLVREMGDYNINANNTLTIKTIDETFFTSGRLDSEYYLPKFDDLFSILSKYETKLLSGEKGLTIISKSIEPGSNYYCDEGVPFVRISNLSKFEITDPEIKIPYDTTKDICKLYPKKDTILLSKDGSVGIAYKLEEDMQCVTSGAILHLKINDTTEILPDYLTLVLNSPIVQMQAERDAGGSIIQHWKPSEIANVVILILPMEVQKEISEKVQESFALRKKSKKLLELAKTAVEIAIEQSEDVAMKMLEDALDE